MILVVTRLSLQCVLSVPRGHSIFNGTQLTIYRTWYGRLTRAKATLLCSLSRRNSCAQSFPLWTSRPFYSFFYVEKSRCNPHRERWVVPVCNLAVEANITRLKHCRRTCCIFNGRNVCFVVVSKRNLLCHFYSKIASHRPLLLWVFLGGIEERKRGKRLMDCDFF